MDASLFKSMLESQERAFKTALDVVVKQMTDRMNQLESKASELTTSLEFSQREIDDLKSSKKECEKELKAANSKIENLLAQLDSNSGKIKQLQDKVNYQEDYSRRNNIRINGMEEQGSGETWEQTAAAVSSLLEQKMELPGIELERAHRVGIRRDGKPRPIIARFSRYCEREAVMRNAKKLKGTNIYVNEDLCPESQSIKMSQMPLLKQARAQGKVAFFRHTKLIIREKTNNAEAAEEQRVVRPCGVSGAVAAGDVVVEMAGAWAGTKDSDTFPSLPAPPSADRDRSRAAPAKPKTPTPHASTTSTQRETRRNTAERRGTMQAGATGKKK